MPYPSPLPSLYAVLLRLPSTNKSIRSFVSQIERRAPGGCSLTAGGSLRRANGACRRRSGGVRIFPRANDIRRARPSSASSSSARWIRSRSIGASVSVSKPNRLRSPAGRHLRCSDRHRILDADAVGSRLVVAGLVPTMIPGCSAMPARQVRDPLRSFVDTEVIADAVAGPVDGRRGRRATSPGGPAHPVASRWCRAESAPPRSQCVPSARA